MNVTFDSLIKRPLFSGDKPPAAPPPPPPPVPSQPQPMPPFPIKKGPDHDH